MDKEYNSLAFTKRARCCGEVPLPLYHITDIGTIKNYPEAIKIVRNHAFQCSKCKTVLVAVVMYTDSYISYHPPYGEPKNNSLSGTRVIPMRRKRKKNPQ